MRFSLRTLLIFMLIAGPLCAVGWQQWQLYQARCEIERQEDRNRIVWKEAIYITQQVSTSSTPSAIWEQQKDSISWESFPESQPPQRFTPPSAAAIEE